MVNVRKTVRAAIASTTAVAVASTTAVVAPSAQAQAPVVPQLPSAEAITHQLDNLRVSFESLLANSGISKAAAAAAALAAPTSTVTVAGRTAVGTSAYVQVADAKPVAVADQVVLDPTLPTGAYTVAAKLVRIDRTGAEKVVATAQQSAFAPAVEPVALKFKDIVFPVADVTDAARYVVYTYVLEPRIGDYTEAEISALNAASPVVKQAQENRENAAQTIIPVNLESNVQVGTMPVLPGLALSVPASTAPTTVVDHLTFAGFNPLPLPQLIASSATTSAAVPTSSAAPTTTTSAAKSTTAAVPTSTTAAKPAATTIVAGTTSSKTTTAQPTTAVAAPTAGEIATAVADLQQGAKFTLISKLVKQVPGGVPTVVATQVTRDLAAPVAGTVDVQFANVVLDQTVGTRYTVVEQLLPATAEVPDSGEVAPTDVQLITNAGTEDLLGARHFVVAPAVAGVQPQPAAAEANPEISTSVSVAAPAPYNRTLLHAYNSPLDLTVNEVTGDATAGAAADTSAGGTGVSADAGVSAGTGTNTGSGDTATGDTAGNTDGTATGSTTGSTGSTTTDGEPTATDGNSTTTGGTNTTGSGTTGDTSTTDGTSNNSGVTPSPSPSPVVTTTKRTTTSTTTTASTSSIWDQLKDPANLLPLLAVLGVTIYPFLVPIQGSATTTKKTTTTRRTTTSRSTTARSTSTARTTARTTAKKSTTTKRASSSTTKRSTTANRSLARTGANVWYLLPLALLCVLAGAVMMFRRRQS